MEELSLHILDIVQNSIAAIARLIHINIEEDSQKDTLSIEIIDDGCGMSEEMQKEVCNPFVTTRTTRKVGLGIPMFKLGAEATGGSFELESQQGVGTRIKAVYGLSHFDRPPLGNVADTIITLIICNPDTPDFIYLHKKDGREYLLDTLQIKEQLGEVPISTPDVIGWMQNDLKEGLEELNGGTNL